jgi:N-methylhydantoinase B/oxoprolinase/acetone carboxylase alpha subunit
MLPLWSRAVRRLVRSLLTQDPNYGSGQLAITAAGLPSDGTVTLADGTTAVVAGQALTSDQLTSLRFKPTPGLFNANSTFAYTVSDPAGNASAAVITSRPTLTWPQPRPTRLRVARPTGGGRGAIQASISAQPHTSRPTRT